MPAHRAARVREIAPFLAMEVMERAQALEREGARVLHLELGEPDLPPAPEVVEACRAALAAGASRYTDSRGIAPLREAIAEEKGRRAGVAVDPARVLVTSGSSPALLLVFGLLVDPGDEVLIATPHYPCYPSLVRLFGGVPVFVPTDASDGFRLHPERVRERIGPRTRALVVASPANPTGAVQSAETLAALADLGLPLVCDEIYDRLVYDAEGAPSALATDGEVYVLDGFSKRHAMTGFRLGYAVVPPEALRPLQVMHQNAFLSVSEFVQHAGLAALRDGEPHVRALRETFAARRTRMVEGLRALGFGVPVAPAGAFYVLADARRFDADSHRLAFRLLEEAHVAVAPGIDFGAAAEGTLRFSYTASEATLAEALERLSKALS